MQASSTNMDKAAIGLSLVCVVHCLVTPVAIALLPVLGTTFLDDERFHYGILFLVLPFSLIALGMGYRKHHRAGIVLTGLFGLCVLFLILILGEEVIGELGEKVTTVIGTLILAFAHVRNYLHCKNHECHSIEAEEVS